MARRRGPIDLAVEQLPPLLFIGPAWPYGEVNIRESSRAEETGVQEAAGTGAGWGRENWASVSGFKEIEI